jgi:hypothetical protein
LKDEGGFDEGDGEVVDEGLSEEELIIGQYRLLGSRVDVRENVGVSRAEGER